jgi:DNA-binding transcriptional LysR family regulator
LTPTPVGQAFYEEVSFILSRAAAAEARVAGQAEKPCGRFRIAAPHSFGRLHIAPHLRNFLDLYDQVEIELLLDDAYVDLLEKKVDVAVRITLPPDNSYDYDLLAPNRRILCASPNYVDKFGKPTSIQDLANHKLLTALHQSPWRLEGPKGALTLEVKSRVMTNCSDVVREAAVSGLGIALRSSWDVSRHLQDGTLVRVLPKWHGASNIGIYAVRPRALQVPINVRAFAAYLKSIYGEVPYWDALL